MKKVILIVGLIAIIGCAQNIYVQHPNLGSSENYGRIIIKLTDAVEGINVRIDGSLVVEDANTKRIEIQRVPVGSRTIEISGSGKYRADAISIEKKVIIQSNKDEIILINTPPKTTSYYLLMFIAIIIPWVIF